MRARIVQIVGVAFSALALVGLTPIVRAPAALADTPDRQPGVSVRLNDFDDVTPTAPEHAAHPDLELISIMAPWSVLEPVDQQFALGAGSTMDQNIQDARTGGYQIVLRIMAGRLEPTWLVNSPSATTVSLLGTDVNASDYCDNHRVVVPWDATLKTQYTQLLDAIGTWLAQPDGAGGTKGDHVFVVPVSMPSFQGTEMNWGYGPATAVCPAGTEGAGQDLSDTNKAAWDAIDPGGTTPVAQREAERRSLAKQAWKDAIDIHMAELPAGVDSSIAYGALFADGQAAAIDIARTKVAEYPTRLWSLYTNLQPEVLTDGSLGTYRQWCQTCHTVMMEVTGAKGLLGYQTASVNINDTAAKFHAAAEDGLATYGMRFLETQPDNVNDYYPYLLTEASNVQSRIRAVNHQRTTATSVSCDPVTVGHATTCTATVSDTDTGAKTPPGGARTVTWPAGGAFSPQTCTPDGTGPNRSCSVTFTPSAAGAQPVTATYLGDSNHNGGAGTVQLTVAKRTSQTDVTCADASAAIGVPTTCTATVIDTSPAPGGSAPTGQVTWSSDASGSFAPATCTLTGSGTTASCQVSFTGAATGNNVGITGTYGADAGHTGSSDGTSIRVTKRSATTAVTCQSPVLVGSASTCTATVTDNDTGTKTTPGGTVTWSGGSGFSSPTCALAGTGATATCSVTYTPATATTVTLSASYGGDAAHVEGSASTTVTSTLRPTSTSVQCDSSVVVGAPASCTATVTDTGAGAAITPTGTVSWSAGGQGTFSSSTCPLSGTGAQASCSVTYTPATTGTPTVVASYGGDQRHASGTASTQITGTARSTSMSVECETPVLVNSAATCTATVHDTDGGTAITPAGQVAWTKTGSGALASPTCTLSGSGGSASCSVDYTPSAAATHTVTATFAGNQQHGSSSGSAQVSATARQTTSSVSCETPAPVGVPTQCTATVTDTDATPAITPSGSVSWSRNGSGTFSSNACQLAGSGSVATCSVTYTRNTVGAETVTATYGGDPAHVGSSGEATVQATKRSTVTAVDCGTPVLVGSSSTCTVTVTDTDSGSAFTPSGDVTWSNSGTGVFGSSTCTLTGSGAAATCSVSYTRSAAGSETVTATFPADTKHIGSAGTQSVEAVLRASTTSVTCGTPVLVGSTSTCTVTVADTGPGTPITPDAAVQWSSVGSGTFSATTCTPAGAGASATCSVTYTPSVSGTHTVTADYPGDQEHQPSTGSAQIRADARLTTTAAQCDTPVLLGASSTCTATVTDTSPGTPITPGGAVHWFSGGEDEELVFPDDDNCTLTGAGAIASCSVTYVPASAGAHDIGATYGGTGVHDTSSDGAQVSVTSPQQTIAFRSSAFAANPVANNLVIPRPSGVQTGDVMVASVAVRSAPTVTPPTGWSLVTTTPNGSNLRQLSYTRVATASEPTSYRWGFNQNRASSGAILAYSGVSTSSPVQAFSGGIGNSATITAPSATTVTTGAMVVGAFSIANGATVTPPSGMTERGEVASSSKIRIEVADVIQPAAGPTGAKAAVATSSAANVGQLIVLRPGSGGGPTPNQDPTFDQNLPDRSDAQGAVISLPSHASDPDNDPLAYSATGLPPGLTIHASTGLISGTISSTAATGSPYAVTVRVSDDGGATVGATDTFTWTVTVGGSGGPVTFRSSSFAANATVQNLVIPKPAGVVAGDVMVAVLDVKVNPTVTAPSGWTLASANSNGSELTQRIYTKVAGATETSSYQWNFNENRAASGGILAYRGVSTTSPLEVVGTVGRATSTAITAPSVTPTSSGTVVLAAFGINNVSAITQPAGTTERGEVASSSKIKTEVAEFVQTTASATGAKTATAASSGVNIGQLIVLRPA